MAFKFKIKYKGKDDIEEVIISNLREIPQFEYSLELNRNVEHYERKIHFSDDPEIDNRERLIFKEEFIRRQEQIEKVVRKLLMKKDLFLKMNMDKYSSMIFEEIENY